MAELYQHPIRSEQDFKGLLLVNKSVNSFSKECIMMQHIITILALKELVRAKDSGQIELRVVVLLVVSIFSSFHFIKPQTNIFTPFFFCYS